MKTGMTLETLLQTVIRENNAKKDYVTSTKDAVRMVPMPTFPHNVAIVLKKDGETDLERFEITEHAHRQISSRLQIPWKYYFRMLTDHTDIVMDSVNKLFEREPSSRLFRTLDGKLRAFLSDRYLRLDNYEVLGQALPAIRDSNIQTQMLASHVGENRMDLKVLFTGDELAQEITSKTRDGSPRIVRPGFRLSNSETGMGSLKIEGFFFDSYCTNGCVFGMIEAFEYRRSHLGGKLIEGTNFEVISDQTRQLEDQAIISHVTDVMKAMGNPEFSRQMGDKLRATASTPSVKDPVAAVEYAVQQLDLKESEKSGILETFIRDGDYSQWGLASAVTEQANRDEVDMDRVHEIEDLGAQILNFSLNRWNDFVMAKAA